MRQGTREQGIGGVRHGASEKITKTDIDRHRYRDRHRQTQPATD